MLQIINCLLKWLMLLAFVTIQAQSLVWVKQAGGDAGSYDPGADQGYGVTTDALGNIYVTGTFRDSASFDDKVVTSFGSHDIFVAKYNSFGNCIWVNRGGSKNYDEVAGICTDKEGNIYIAGNCEGNSNFSGIQLRNKNTYSERDVFIVKYDSNGNCIWAKYVGNSNSIGIGIESKGISIDDNGDLYIIGETYYKHEYRIKKGTKVKIGTSSINPGSGFIAKYDQKGKCLWVKDIGSCTPNKVVSDSNGNHFVAGMLHGSCNFGKQLFKPDGNEHNDLFLAKFDANGNNLWANQIKGPYQEFIYDLNIDLDGNSVIIGTFPYESKFNNIILTNSSSAYFITKYNPDGKVIWAVPCEENPHTFDGKIIIASDGNCYLPLTKQGENSIVSEKGIVTFSTNSDDFEIRNTCIDSEGDFILTGSFEGSKSFGSKTLRARGKEDILILKYRVKK